MSRSSSLVRFAFVLSFAAAAARGQAPEGSGTAAEVQPVRLVVRAGGVLDAERLRQAFERELGVPVERAGEPAAAHLLVEAATLGAVRVAFVREDGRTVERTVDASSTAEHAHEAIALLGANLMRDEAAELLEAAPRGAAAAPLPAASAQPKAEPAIELPRGCDPNRLQRVDVGADFVPMLGTSLRDGTRVERRLSLNLIGGMTGAVRGFEIAGVFNLDRHAVCGVQIGGIANLVGGPVEGLQLGLINSALGRLDGVQIGLVGVATGPLTGAQLGLVQVGAHDVEGAQLGLVNVGGGRLHGAQLGLVNVNPGRAQGAQVGLLNVNAAEMEGAQVGLANVGTGPIRGAAVGLLNVVQDADAAVGLVSVVWKGRTHADVWATDAGLLLAGVIHGSRHVHNVYGVGAGMRHDQAMLAVAYGLGIRAFANDDLFVDVDAIAYGLFLDDSAQNETDIATLAQLRVPISYRFTPAFAVFVSPALTVSVALDADNNVLREPGLYGVRLSKREANTSVFLWPGLTLGARFF